MNLLQLPVVIRRDVSTAKLPINYELAKSAIRECARIDQCKDWSDRHAAIASYARQARDTSLKDAANRIVLRAEERIGELLLEIPTGISPTRSDVAKQHGLSRTRVSRATAIARVPRDVREPLIEKSPPISPERLASLGKQGRVYAAQRANTDILFGSYLATIIRWIENNSAKDLARSIPKKDSKMFREHVRRMEEWLDEFEQNLQK